MIRDWTDIELNRLRTEAYMRYANLKYSGASAFKVHVLYCKYVALDDLIQARDRELENLTLRQDFRYNEKEKTS